MTSKTVPPTPPTMPPIAALDNPGLTARFVLAGAEGLNEEVWLWLVVEVAEAGVLVAGI